MQSIVQVNLIFEESTNVMNLNNLFEIKVV